MVKGVSKVFGSTRAVDHVNLEIKPGMVYGLLGRNGAGKTTLLRTLLGIVDVSSGTTEIFGERFSTASEKLRQRVAYISQDYRFYNSYTLDQFLNFVKALYPKWNEAKEGRLIKDFELSRDKYLGTLSGGQRQKASLVVALCCGAELLILDEPASALDPLSRRMVLSEMMDFINENPEQNTILFSTHIVTDLERVATHVGMMANGKITHNFELDDIHDSMRQVQACFDDTSFDFNFDQAISVQKEGKIVNAIYNVDLESVKAELAELETIAKVTSFPVNLEEFFVQIYGASELKGV